MTKPTKTPLKCRKSLTKRTKANQVDSTTALSYTHAASSSNHTLKHHIGYITDTEEGSALSKIREIRAKQQPFPSSLSKEVTKSRHTAHLVDFPYSLQTNTESSSLAENITASHYELCSEHPLLQSDKSNDIAVNQGIRDGRQVDDDGDIMEDNADVKRQFSVGEGLDTYGVMC